MTEENLKVAVRVRPFNDREKNAKSKLIVQMAGNQTIITNPKTNEEKKYAYDFSYWSHDGFKVDASGYSVPENSKYADQQKVFNDLGSGILKNAWEGYNASLFAYGQTGSGKSYSVIGYGANKGIVPITCEEIFKKADSMKGSDKTVECTFSMLEIYSEMVRDLLGSKAERKTGMQVREDPKIGFYAQGQKKILVDSYDDITKLMDEGNSNRTIAATNMNATSSRAHTIVTVNLVQKYKNEAGKEMAKSSMINLVDLAGSERADATGATGDRLKEGAAINLSLTSLGNVISALADNSAGKNVKVPYRDSVLTKLLMNALGGNSKTIMIAAISPADINFDESVSTLRYADRAKQIKTKAMINEDPTEKLIKELREENAKLKKMLESGGKIDPALLNGTEDNDAEEEALRKQLAENDKAMKSMQQTYEEKLAEAKSMTENLRSTKIHEQAKTIPHLRNVNMDPSLSGTIIYLIEGEGLKKVGSGADSQVKLKGIGILESHATITSTGGKFKIERHNDAKVLRNGKPLTVPSDLVHLDRLLFGTSQYYIFIEPSKATPKDPQATFESMQDEIAKAAGLISKDNKNMTQEEIQCQSELIDLIPHIEEANAISIALDKKVIFTALPVSADARGDYDGKFRVFVSVKNFALGLEWIWTKEKFLNRKSEIVEIYNDLKDDQVIQQEKYKKYDPFYESPDTPTLVGSAMVFPKSFAYMLTSKGDYKILSLKSKEAGLLNVEIIPCNGQGKPLTEAIQIRDPKTELLNKTVTFLITINEIKNLSEKYEDIYCQFQLFGDKTLYKTNVIKGGKDNSFKYSKQFTFIATEQLLDFLMNKCLYIQIWSEQKHAKPDPVASKITTKEYFDREKELKTTCISGKVVINHLLDPEKQKLKDDLNIALIKNQQNETILNNIYKLMHSAGKSPISRETLNKIINAKNDAEVQAILAEYAKNNNVPGKERPTSASSISSVDSEYKGRRGHNKSQACNIL
ncbi:unnamed protein product [Brachionus calyciflorus]|uniref:Kinesin-like protein n=1 Tax=Brachionus calyciflorus TaxID=104777 RepID=A0A813QY11_9BILA|nr:unnamed protein product [Brachionus calyciflorus]CAF0775081.1 unnamed protein product [Brachionus calyciflorus]